MPRFLGRFVIGAGALLISATAQAQGTSNAPARPWKIGGALGATIPLGNFSDAADLGWHLGGLFEYKQPSLPVTWRGELAAHWFSGYLNLHLVEGAAKLVPARALVGFHESEFTVPARRVRQLWPKSSPSAKAEADCWAWLEQIAKDHPDRQPKPKPRMWGEAKARWPRLSRRAFDRCWAKAVRAAPGWARHERRGRPRRDPAP